MAALPDLRGSACTATKPKSLHHGHLGAECVSLRGFSCMRFADRLARCGCPWPCRVQSSISREPSINFLAGQGTYAIACLGVRRHS